MVKFKANKDDIQLRFNRNVMDSDCAGCFHPDEMMFVYEFANIAGVELKINEKGPMGNVSVWLAN
jgi:hypothetical protein